MRRSVFRRRDGARGEYVRRMQPGSAASRYRIAIHRAKGCYFALVIDLPGCIARGATEVEAVENARGAIRAYLCMAEILAGESATVHLEIPA
jgi:predicted RNase H-like HicB family nuclease